jgi:large subunit ribosomal protein L9
MEVILIKDVDNLGAAHELVEVRPGYARNYLIPQKYAIEASSSNKKILEERRKVLAKREEKLMAEIAKVAEVLKSSPVKLGAKIGTSGKILCYVPEKKVARAIGEKNFYQFDRRRISIIEDVKEAGTYKAQIDFGKENVVDLEFEVVAE